MLPLLILTILLSVDWVGIPGRALGQDQFYQGKVLRIIVGFVPGGGYDTYTRLVARHLGKHIPGNPSVVVAGAISTLRRAQRSPQCTHVDEFGEGRNVEATTGERAIGFRTQGVIARMAEKEHRSLAGARISACPVPRVNDKLLCLAAEQFESV